MKKLKRDHLEFSYTLHYSGMPQWVNEEENIKVRQGKDGFWRLYFKPNNAKRFYAMGLNIYENLDDALTDLVNSPKRRIA